MLRVYLRKTGQENKNFKNREFFLKVFFVIWFFLILAKLFYLQVLNGNFYYSLAADKREILTKLFPERGKIYIRDKDGNYFPFATNKNQYLVFVDTREIKTNEDREKILQAIIKIFGPSSTTTLAKEEEENFKNWKQEILARLNKIDDPYEPLIRKVSEEKIKELEALKLPGIHFSEESARFYPFGKIGSQLVGFVGEDQSGKKIGRYGLELFFESRLRGKEGILQGEKDVFGRIIPLKVKMEEAQNGEDLYLTIDRNIQFVACSKLEQAVKKHQASSGSVVILNPQTGEILAMCGFPDFDPNNFSEVKDFSVFNNPVVSQAYEPGSVMKAITMAAGLDLGLVNPETTYEDKGFVQIGPHTIYNAEKKAFGTQTMIQVLEKSLNTGAIFVANKIGLDKFRDYLLNFGFGQKTGIELPNENPGDISNLNENKIIYLATASFGQGISVTPIQLAQAFAAIANGGKLMKPYLVEKIMRNNEVILKNNPTVVRQVISTKTALILSGMLVNVVENGHGKRAGVPGYFVAGKTGTAQIPIIGGKGYEPNATIGTFAGFAPVENPRFVMVVRIDRPKDVQFAESSAAPLFGEIAQYLLQYLEVKPTRSK